jgi:hypothetical protein
MVETRASSSHSQSGYSWEPRRPRFPGAMKEHLCSSGLRRKVIERERRGKSERTACWACFPWRVGRRRSTGQEHHGRSP